MLYVTRMTQNKNDSIKSILQYGRVVDKNCCVVFPASRLPYFILCPRQCKGKVATTYLAIGLVPRTIKIFEYTHSFFVIFNSNIFSALHAKHLEIWKNF